jgi:hypothetical protein
MQKDELWKIYTEKNPDFLTGPVKFTAKGLKKFFDQTFEMGAKSVKREKQPNSSPSNNQFGDLMGDLFGKSNPFG